MEMTAYGRKCRKLCRNARSLLLNVMACFLEVNTGRRLQNLLCCEILIACPLEFARDDFFGRQPLGIRNWATLMVAAPWGPLRCL